MEPNQLGSSLTWNRNFIRSIEKKYAFVNSFINHINRSEIVTDQQAPISICTTMISNLVKLEDLKSELLQKEIIAPSPILETNSQTPQKKPKHRRQHYLLEFMKEIYIETPNKAYTVYWSYLEKLARAGHPIIKKVPTLTDTSHGKITWLSHTGKIRHTGCRRFQNIISQLSTEFNKNHA